MRTQLTHVRANSIRPLLAATLALAITFTLSCSGDSSPSSGGGGESGTFTDTRSNKVYKWTKIGSQTWMAENLNYNAPGSKCYGVNEITTLSDAEIQANCTTYGRLYDWETAMTVCPQSWHLPSDAEWTTLIDFVGGSNTAGTKLKATSGWDNSGFGEDTYGFSALPGGYGSSNGYFYNVGRRGCWWSTTEYNASSAYFRRMYYDNANVGRFNNDKSDLYLFSVRCLQD
jgi:uncharacterized protein (TIGR02145 family)